MPDAPAPFVALGPEGGEHVSRGQRHHRILCELEPLEVLELRFGPDFEGVPPHVHANHADCFYVLEGVAEVTVGDRTVRAEAGSFVAVPAGLEHGFGNAGPGELRLLNVHAPGPGFADRVRRE